MTYADKYALMKAYKIVTGDDPDQHHSPDTTTILDNQKQEKTDGLISGVQISALKSMCINRGITRTGLQSCLEYFGYNKVEEIKTKDYMEIYKRLDESKK